MNVRQKERVLLGLDEAFGVAPRSVGVAAAAGTFISTTGLNEALYHKLPSDLIEEVSRLLVTFIYCVLYELLVIVPTICNPSITARG